MTKLIAPFATGPTPNYWITDVNSDLSRIGALWNKVAGDDNYPPPPYTPGGVNQFLSWTIPANSMVEGMAYTVAGVPGLVGTGGNYTLDLRMDPNDVDANVNMSFLVYRFNAAGFVQANSLPSTEQVSTAAAILNLTISSPDLGAWAEGDRLGIGIRARNTAAHGRTRVVQALLGQ